MKLYANVVVSASMNSSGKMVKRFLQILDLIWGFLFGETRFKKGNLL